VDRINTYFQRLKPVALQVPLESEGVFFRRLETIDLRQRGHLATPHKGKNHAVTLNTRITVLLNISEVHTALGFSGLFQTMAIRIEKPAMKRATEAAVFQTAKAKVCPAVRAVSINQSQGSLLIAKKNKPFTQDCYCRQRTISDQFLRQRYRLPVTA
jgi:hypothetical protein